MRTRQINRKMPAPPASYDLAPGDAVLRFVGYKNKEIHFRLKQTTPIMKAMRVFSERVGEPLTNLRFFYKRWKIRTNDTHQSLAMKIDDCIRVIRITAAIKIKAICKLTNRQFNYCANRRIRLKKMMRTFCKDAGISLLVPQLSFTYNGKIIREDRTLRELRIQQDDVIMVEHKAEE